MKKFIFYTIQLFLAACFMAACCGDEPTPAPEPDPTPNPEQPNPTPTPEQPGRKRTILVYAVASNNLVSDFYDDSEEMLDGMKQIDTEEYSLLVYRVFRSGDVALLEATSTDDGMDFTIIKEYDNQTLSTDPRRLTEVIEDAIELRPAQSYGLFFWAHGSSWEPEYSQHTPLPLNQAQPPMLYAYGGDQTTGVSDWMDIDEMASAIPDNTFDFIWFDNCFMSSIEVIYQLRNKANFMVAYPTEIYSYGAPYESIIPLVMKPEADLTEAAKETFNFYNFQRLACTVAVMDLSKIEAVADACEKANSNFTLVKTLDLQKYSRFSYGPYFDFVQLTKRIGANSPDFDETELDRAMADFVIYKACSAKNFSGKEIDPENYSGISAHAYKVYTTHDEYYRSLDWYKRIMNGQ